MCHSCELDCDITIEYLEKACCVSCIECARYFDAIAHGDVSSRLQYSPIARVGADEP